MTVNELADKLDWIMSEQCDVTIAERRDSKYYHLGEFPLFEFKTKAERDYGGYDVLKIEHYPRKIAITAVRRENVD